MRSKSLIWLALLLCVAALPAWAQNRARRGATKKTPVAAAPQIPVKVIGNDELRQLLTRTGGQKPFLVNFWATWCEPCVEEFPELVKVNGEYGGRGLEFITISMDEMSEAKTGVPRFLQRMKSPMPAYLLNMTDQDAALAIIDKDWIGALPLTLLYDGNGQVVYRRVGRIKFDELRTALDKQLPATQARTQ